MILEKDLIYTRKNVKMVNKIFSIENNPRLGRTFIRLFGLKFNYINKKVIMKPTYKEALEKIHKKYKNNEKIKVGFLVNQNAKWNAENLYNLLANHNAFEPVILVSAYDSLHYQKDITKDSVSENYNFFKSTGKNVLKAYDEKAHKYLDLQQFDIDILFYQQPWGIDKSQSIDIVSNYALCCYYAYGISVLDCPLEVRPFHEKLYSYFIPNKQTFNLLKKYEIKDLNNLKIIGYPKLDVYNDLTKKEDTSKKTIIYAPHHSYNRSVHIGTFDKLGKQILKFAKQHSEYNWIFKPHPDLKEVLYKDIRFGKKFVDKYYQEWAKLGQSYEKGSYFQLFMDSDLLITDCDAFLLEYMPTGSPIIRLERKGGTKLSELGQDIIQGIYRVRKFKDFKKSFDEVMNKNNDELLNKRKEITENIIRKTKNASKNIVQDLEKIIKGSL